MTASKPTSPSRSGRSRSSSAHRSKPASTPGHPDARSTCRSVRPPDSLRSRASRRSRSTARAARSSAPANPSTPTSTRAPTAAPSGSGGRPTRRGPAAVISRSRSRTGRPTPPTSPGGRGGSDPGHRSTSDSSSTRTVRGPMPSGAMSRGSARAVGTGRVVEELRAARHGLGGRGASAHPARAAAVARADAVVVAGRRPRRSGRDRPLRHRRARGARGDGVGRPRRLAGRRTPDVGARRGRAGARRQRRRSARACRPPLRSRDRTAGCDRRGVRAPRGCGGSRSTMRSRSPPKTTCARHSNASASCSSRSNVVA